MSDSYLEIKNVDFTIGGKIKVKNASFAIENEGDTLCILGPSGIGKTTILRTIAIVLSIVVFPIPEGPRIHKVSPSFSIAKDAFLTLIFPPIVKSTFLISK